MDLRDLQLLAALARHGHFARAAEACGISQPAFSARIRGLEEKLGAALVRRGNRLAGFTPEGEIALRWARRITADADALRQEVRAAQGALSGTLALAAVPTALTFAAGAAARLRLSHPGLTPRLVSMASTEIRRGLEDGALDAGFSYVDAPPPQGLRAVHLYDERYILVAPAALAPRLEGSASWAEAAALPLCLLTPDMRNRRILDEVFRAHLGASPVPVIETNAFTAALAQVSAGAAATIAPRHLVESFGVDAGVVALPLTEPEATSPIGLLMRDRDPTPLAVAALLGSLGR